MNADRRALVRIALVAGLPWGLFAACAEGSSIEPPPASTTGAGAGAGDAGIPPGQVGGTCEEAKDCPEGASCTQVGSQKFCTVACPPACPQGTYCAIIEGDPICVPDQGQQCLQCNATVDCKSPSDSCLTAPPGDRFCAIDCTTMGTCPTGFSCVEAALYQSGNWPGTGGGGSGGGGGAGGSEADAGSTGSGPPPPSGQPYKFCVPDNGLSCPCDDKREGITHSCYRENEHGRCTGTESCNGQQWQGCSAALPAAEVCNDADDDCDDQPDNADPEQLCGASPPHATWACIGGDCQLGMCEEGWTQFPPGPPSEGCPCQLEPEEPNNGCATATNAGTVTDAAPNSLVIHGTLSSAGDFDFWSFNTIDTNQANTNSYHVSIDFTGPMPNSEFQFDVIRGDACVDVPSGPATSITSYDWCVDGTSAGGNEGEGNCGPTSPVHCENHSSKYYLRVSRKPGATSTCAQYQVTITAFGGDACDFTKKCP